MILNKVIDFFNKNGGEIFINTVFIGGSYTFLLNRSLNKPILVIDASKNYTASGKISLKYIYNETCDDVTIKNLDELFGVIDVNTVYINHLIWAKTMGDYIELILYLKHKYKLAFEMYIHDFYSVCPSTNLLNYKNEYCGIPNESSCNQCLQFYAFPNGNKSSNKIEVMSAQMIHRHEIVNWRKFWRKLFDEVELFIFPSNAAKEIWLKAFPAYVDKTSVLHHDLSYIQDIVGFRDYCMDEFFNVYIIGDIVIHKGSTIIHEILSLIAIKKLPIRINVLGSYKDPTFENTHYLKNHGRFQHSKIAEILNSKHINCFLMPSICPETFSYATHEMIATNLPVIAFNIGAQGQFVNEYKYGITVNNINSESMFQEIFLLYEKHKQILYSDLYQNCSNIHIVDKFVQKQEQYLIEKYELLQNLYNSRTSNVTRLLKFVGKVFRKVLRAFK